MPQEFESARFQIDHAIAQKHSGNTALDNLALCCIRCNLYKGPNIAGLDPITGVLTALFHPRRDTWAEHFTWNGPLIVGLSAVGRTTVFVLNMNHHDALSARQALLELGVFPPP